MLAVGIYNIDAAEANAQNIKMPSDNAKAKTGNVIDKLNSISNSSSNVSNAASNIGWNSILFSGGKSTGLFSKASAVAGTANTIGGIAGSVGQVAGTAKTISSIFGGGSKDKVCKQVPKKSIEIGEHNPPNATAALPKQEEPKKAEPHTAAPAVVVPPTVVTITVISIPKISSGTLRELSDSLRHKNGVKSVEKSYAEALSTINVTHSDGTDSLADWIDDNFKSKLKVDKYSIGKISLSPKLR